MQYFFRSLTVLSPDIVAAVLDDMLPDRLTTIALQLVDLDLVRLRET